MNLISHAEDFKVLNKTLEFNSAHINQQGPLTNKQQPQQNIDQINLQKYKLRDLNEMLDDVFINNNPCYNN